MNKTDVWVAGLDISGKPKVVKTACRVTEKMFIFDSRDDATSWLRGHRTNIVKGPHESISKDRGVAIDILLMKLQEKRTAVSREEAKIADQIQMALEL